MTTTEEAKRLQLEGNALYGGGRYAEARGCYSAALALLEASPEDSHAAAKAQLLSNRAQTFIQERDFAAALQDCTKALKLDAANEKAALRRLVALENLERFEAAFALVEAVLERRGAREHSPALFQYAVTARRRLRKNLARDKAAAESEIAQMGKMVHSNQQLRINFGHVCMHLSLIPSRMPLGEFVDVAVNIGNEFGLYRRDYVRPGERIFLHCTLRNNADAAFKLVFHAASDDVGESSESAARDDGRLTLNDRGKAVFRVAVVAAFEAAEEATLVPRANLALQVTVHADSRVSWDLFPVVSLPFDVVASGAALEEADINDLGVHCCRPVEMEGVDREILLAESPGNLGIGGKLWDSCLVMTRYLALHRTLIEGKSVVELGSGLGLVGIFCAMLGARVTLTDISDVVPLLQYNIALNFPGDDDCSTAASGESSIRPTAATHLWGSETSNLPTPHPEVLVLSDVVYDPEGYVPLVTSLDALATDHTVVLMAHRSRNPMEHQFFELLGAKFAYELVDWASDFAAADKLQQQEVEATASGGQSQRAALQDVKIFRMRRL